MPFHQLAANYFCSYPACSENSQFICIPITLTVAKHSVPLSSATVTVWGGSRCSADPNCCCVSPSQGFLTGGKALVTCLAHCSALTALEMSTGSSCFLQGAVIAQAERIGFQIILYPLVGQSIPKVVSDGN